MNDLIAWAAGFLDGDGSVSLLGQNPRLVVQAHQVTAEPLLRLQQLFGGSVHMTPAKPPRQAIYAWQLEGRRAEAALRAMLPYLTTKRRDAELALEFRATIGLRPRREPLAPEVAARRRALKAELQNGRIPRGIVDTLIG